MDLDPQAKLAGQLQKPSGGNLRLWIIIGGLLVVAIVAMMLVIPFLPPPGGIDQLILRGQQEYARRDFASAVKTFERVTQLDPKRGMAWNYLGVMARDQNRLEDAERFFKKAVEVDPLTTGNHYNLGQLYLRMNRLDEAEAEWKASMKLGPKAQYLYQYAQIAEKRNLGPEEIAKRLRMVVDNASDQALTLTLEPELLAKDVSIVTFWSFATRKLMDLNDNHGLIVAALVYADPKTRPDVSELAADVLRQAGAPKALLAVLADDRPENRRLGLAALEKLTGTKLAFDPDADPSTRENQLAALKQNPVLNQSQSSQTQNPED